MTHPNDIEAKAVELSGVSLDEFCAADVWLREAFREQARLELLRPGLQARAARQTRDSRGRFQRAPRQVRPRVYRCGHCEASDGILIPHRSCSTCCRDTLSDLDAALDAVGDHDSRVWSENVEACRCDRRGALAIVWHRIKQTIGGLWA